MNVQVIKSKAEQSLQELITNRLAKLPGDAEVRKAASEVFTSKGLPHRRIEEWKYFDLHNLLADAVPTAGATEDQALIAADAKRLDHLDTVTFVFADGKLISEPEDGIPEGVTIESLAVAITSDPGVQKTALPETADDGITSVNALNTALASDGATIRIDDGVKPEKPIHLIFASSGTTANKNAISVGKNATAQIIETHISASDAPRNETTVCTVTLADGATLHHAVHLEVAEKSVQLSATPATLGADATYLPFHFTSGDGLARHQMLITFSGERASLDFSAVTLAAGNGHFDTTMVIDHAVPNCTSRELFKTVLDDNARSIFQGKVIVRQDAQKTDGKQMAQALMLSPTTEFDSKPELEIYADDVLCGHGTTSAELDADLLFYLRSRGIPQDEARAILIESFIGEAVDKIEHEGLRDVTMATARTWLTAMKEHE